MPLKLNVGLSKKVGLPDYGSMGASCHVELEVDGTLLQQDLDRFHQHVQRAFVACRQAVQDELARHGSQVVDPNGHESQHSAAQASSNGRYPARERAASNGQAHGHSDGDRSASGNSRSRPRLSKQATRNQLEYASELAERIHGVGLARLDDLTERMFGKSLSNLSKLEASNLIATLRDMEAGKIAPQAVFGGAAA